MKAENVNAVATGGIFFITFVAAMVGFYHNLNTTGTRTWIIVVFELVFVFTIALFMRWLKKEVEKHG